MWCNWADWVCSGEILVLMLGIWEEVENDYDKNDDEENHDHDINSLLLVI
jgi:hypothetical protein